jgi:hypothetical protein
MLLMSFVPSTFADDHAPAPPVGFVDVSTFPLWSTATQSDTEGHETPKMPFTPSTLVYGQADLPPVGLVEDSISPKLSPAMHSDAEGHETLNSTIEVPIVAVLHALAPPVGLIEVTMSPEPYATHSDTEGHETPPRRVFGSTDVYVHELGRAGPVGFIELTIPPPASVATHSDTEGHEIPVVEPFPSALVGDLQISGPAASAGEADAASAETDPQRTNTASNRIRPP